MPDKVTFSGSFPPIQSAIKVSGDGSGMRIMIDIPESEMAEAVKLMLYRQVPLRITIEPHEQPKAENSATAGDGSANDRTPKRTKAKRRV